MHSLQVRWGRMTSIATILGMSWGTWDYPQTRGIMPGCAYVCAIALETPSHSPRPRIALYSSPRTPALENT